VTNEPRWEDIFNQQPDPAAETPAANAKPQPEAPWNPAAEFTAPASARPAEYPQTAALPTQPGAEQAPDDGRPLTRREMREREAGQTGAQPARESTPVAAPPAAGPPVVAASGAPGAAAPAGNDAAFDSFFASQPMATAPATRTAGRGGGSGGGSGDGAAPREKKPKRRGRFVWLFILIGLLAAAGGAVAYVWLNYEEQVREVMGWELPIDHEGTGNGEEVIVVIKSGDNGGDIAQTLYDTGVTMTVKAFYELLLENPDVTFHPGNFALQKEMSAQSALDALLDDANKITQQAVIPEGTTLSTFLEILANATEIPLADFQAAAATPTAFGVPAEAPSLEGYLFPATYTLEPGLTAQQVLQVMVDRMFQSLDAAGVAPENRHTVLTMAGLIQKEGGPEADFPKVSRVFTNRIEQGMLLQSDATVSYGAGSTSIFTTDAERADASNPYNTYANPGLPVGPISAPGDAAINAALNPVDGPWLYFVLINGITGETQFSTTNAEHNAAVRVWQQWLRDNPDWNTGE